MEKGAGVASVPEAIEWLRKRFRADAAQGSTITYRFDLAGESGGCFALRIEDGRLALNADEAQAPDVTYRLAASDFFAILDGTANPDLLFMEDRIGIDGDLSLALKLRTFFGSRA